HPGQIFLAYSRFSHLLKRNKTWDTSWGLLFVVYGILGALLVPFGITRFFTACVWVGVMSNVWVTLRQSVRI
ncbi:hypothetical protein QP958_01480, partial [Corynebacterium marquesiae]|uniref:hypothetical protein n=1 Tax=Corynebacterium marquesiae TaxID=2913503 RepID=UPI0025510C54